MSSWTRSGSAKYIPSIPLVDPNTLLPKTRLHLIYYFIVGITIPSIEKMKSHYLIPCIITAYAILVITSTMVKQSDRTVKLSVQISGRTTGTQDFKSQHEKDVDQPPSNRTSCSNCACSIHLCKRCSSFFDLYPDGCGSGYFSWASFEDDFKTGLAASNCDCRWAHRE